MIESARFRTLGPSSPRESGLYVLYWMTTARRTYWNLALQHAAVQSRELGKPLVVCEPLWLEESAPTTGHPQPVDYWFDGFPVNAQRLSLAGVLYHPYVAPAAEEATRLFETLAERASLVVCDAAPPRAVGDTPVLRVETAGLLLAGEVAEDGSTTMEGPKPAGAPASRNGPSEAFRKHFQEQVRNHFHDFPERNPLAKFDAPPLQALLPRVQAQWPAASGLLMGGAVSARAELGWPSLSTAADKGGTTVAQATWRTLLMSTLERAGAVATPESGKVGGQAVAYTIDPGGGAEPPSVPDGTALERVSRFLEHGQTSPHQVLAETWRATGWTPQRLSEPTGKETGFWGLHDEVERMLDAVLVPHEARVHGAT